jgi:hypothetical protein
MQVEGDIQTDRMRIATDSEVKVAGHMISANSKAQPANQSPRQG